MIFQKNKFTPNEEKMNEYKSAQIFSQQSLIQYIAIMSDIELPSGESDMNDEMGISVMDSLSTNGKKAQYYYDSGFWTKTMVYNVTKKGWISQAEYEEITGESFD